MNDELTLYGQIEISVDDDGSVRLVDAENEYECAFDPDEFDEIVDYVHETRLKRSN